MQTETLHEHPASDKSSAGDVDQIGASVLAFESHGDIYDAFEDMLPVMLSPESPDRDEPTFDQLDPGRTKTKYVIKMQEREALERAGRITEGTRIVILYSDIGEKNKTIIRNGQEVVVSDYFRSDTEGKEHIDAAESVKHSITTVMGQDPDQVTIKRADRETIDEALRDQRVGHLIYIGHANRSQLTIDPIYTYNWHETPQLDHLKKSFGVFGCGTLKNEKYYPRIGSTFVASTGIIYGVPGDFLEEGQPYHFDQLVRHPNLILEHTPLTDDKTKAS